MFTRIEGLRVFYEASSGTGIPVLLLHGWGADSTKMQPIFSALKSAGIQVYALDFPGFGLSDVPADGWDVSHFVSTTIDFMDQFRLDKVRIIGHSFGGRVAIKLAAKYPERVERAVLIASAGIRPRVSILGRIWSLVAPVLGALTRRLPSTMTESLRQRALHQLGFVEYAGAGARRETYKKVVNEDLRPFLPEVKCPTLLIWGELDTKTPLTDGQLMASRIPHARLEVLRGVGHWCFLQDFTAFWTVLAPFIVGE